MSRDPAVLFYTSDFLIGTEHLEDAEVGQYIRLLCYQHQKGHLSQEFVHRVCRGNAGHMLMDKFIQDENGLYYNKRMDEEIEKRSNYSKNQRDRALKRWGKGKCRGNAVAMPGENVNENISIIIDEIYNLYPSKRSNGSSTGKRPKDKEKIIKHLKAGVDLKELIRLYVLKTDPRYYKAMQTFLNGLPDIEELKKANDFKDQSKLTSSICEG